MNNKFLKGVCYAPFPKGYTPFAANESCIFFGSDIASYNMKPLWGDSFTPKSGTTFKGRDDIKNLSAIGVNLIRLYGWDYRNNHIPFLDYCEENDIKVLVSVPNHYLCTNIDENSSITQLINSFSKHGNYHPAIYGILIGNELDQDVNISIECVINYTKKWAEVESIAYYNYRKVLIGHSISSAKKGLGWESKFPCFGYLDEIIPPLFKITRSNLNTRLFIASHIYKDASYLYNNAEGTNKGWVDLCYNRYKLPILFCEIGCSRKTRSDYLDVVSKQLEQSIAYHTANKDKLLGACYFQYCDKAWCPHTTEGSFGMTSNTNDHFGIVTYGDKDFNHWIGVLCNGNKLNIQILKSNPVYNVIKRIYKDE